MKRVTTPPTVKLPGRRRGRPAGVSRDDLIDATMDLLTTYSCDELSLAMLADRAGVAVNTLYNYFSNRETLLSAVADRAFSLLELPDANNDSWQQQLLAWLWAVQAHCKTYPVILKVMGFEGGVSSAWVDAVSPAYRILRDRGLSGRELAQVGSWFFASATGLIIADSVMPLYLRPTGPTPLESLDPDTQEMYSLMSRHTADIGSEEWLDFGFKQLITSLEQALGQRPE